MTGEFQLGEILNFLINDLLTNITTLSNNEMRGGWEDQENLNHLSILPKIFTGSSATMESS